MTEFRVRQMVPVGAHIGADGFRVLNQPGDVYTITDAYLNRDYLSLGGPQSVEELVQSYVDAGFVEIVE